MRTQTLLRLLFASALLALGLTGCGFLKKISTNRFDRAKHGPADSAIVVLDTALYASEVPQTEDPSFKEELGALFEDAIRDLLHIGKAPEELQRYALEPDDAELESAFGTARGFSVQGHLVFLDVAPGEIRLTALWGRRPIPPLQQRELYDCAPSEDAASTCPEYWLHRFDLDSPITAHVEAGQVLYLGRVSALGYFEPPPYDSFALATVESWNNTWEERRSDESRVEVIDFSTASIPAEERAALTDLRDRVDKDDWKAAITERLEQLETGGT